TITTTAIPNPVNEKDNNPSEHYSLYNSDSAYGIRNFTVKNANDSIPIFVEEIGDPKNPTVIFLHGFLYFRLIFNPVFKNEFLYKNFHLVRFDSRGVLDSGKPTDPNQYTLDHHAQDLKAVVDAITNANPGKKITLVGWSLGVAISTLYLGTFGQDKVNGFLTIGAKLESTAFDSTLLASIPQTTDYQEVIESRYASPNFLIGKDRPPLSEETALFFLGGTALTSTVYPKPTITSLLILHGGSDQVVPTIVSEHFLAEVKYGKRIVYAESGHLLFWEEPERFAKDLKEFVMFVNKKN
ncbi:7337_t:CDS:2, partial [Ambispora leptoticha]